MADAEKASVNAPRNYEAASTLVPVSSDEITTGKSKATGETDPNIVDWDGPDDPQNPKNWPDSKKWLNVAVLSLLTIITCV